MLLTVDSVNRTDFHFIDIHIVFNVLNVKYFWVKQYSARNLSVYNVI